MHSGLCQQEKITSYGSLMDVSTRTTLGLIDWLLISRWPQMQTENWALPLRNKICRWRSACTVSHDGQEDHKVLPQPAIHGLDAHLDTNLACRLCYCPCRGVHFYGAHTENTVQMEWYLTLKHSEVFTSHRHLRLWSWYNQTWNGAWRGLLWSLLCSGTYAHSGFKKIGFRAKLSGIPLSKKSW